MEKYEYIAPWGGGKGRGECIKGNLGKSEFVTGNFYEAVYILYF